MAILLLNFTQITDDDFQPPSLKRAKADQPHLRPLKKARVSSPFVCAAIGGFTYFF